MICVVLVLLIFAVTFALIIIHAAKRESSPKSDTIPIRVNAKKFSNAAVAADNSVCSTVGTNIVMKGGSAADSAIATVFCTGVANPFSCGIGGGGFLVYYERNTSEFHVYDYRETAPAAANETMYLNKSSTIGILLCHLFF